MWPVTTLIWASSFLPPPIRASMVTLVEGGAGLVGLVGSLSWEFAWILVADFETQVSRNPNVLAIVDESCSGKSPLQSIPQYGAIISWSGPGQPMLLVEALFLHVLHPNTRRTCYPNDLI